jgi:hypothetical protein
VASHILTETKRYFRCPNGCDHKFYVEHLFESMKKDNVPSTKAGPWHCDVCRKGWFLTLQFDGALALELCKTEYTTAWVTLEIPANNPHPIRFRVRHKYVEVNKPFDEAIEHHRYFYEEHTCPTNWLQDVVEVEVDGDCDPHGLARYVSSQHVLAAVDICQNCGHTFSDGYLMDDATKKRRGIPKELIVCSRCNYIQKGIIIPENMKRLAE